MGNLVEETAAFMADRSASAARARQRAAAFLSGGIDLACALEQPRQCRERIVLRLRRLIERERLRGARRHWSYDLNRHIALKQALDSLLAGWTAAEDEPAARKPI